MKTSFARRLVFPLVPLLALVVASIAQSSLSEASETVNKVKLITVNTPTLYLDPEFLLKGSVTFWARPACSQTTDCPPPIALSPKIPVSFLLRPSFMPGPQVVTDAVTRFRKLRLHWLIVWVNSDPTRKVPPYAVTQLKLVDEEAGVIAECSRYDAASALSFLPPGSCSGRVDSKMIGVSLFAE